MKQTAIFGPMFAMLLLTLIVWVVMFARRIRFISSADLTPEQLMPLEFARLSPPAVANASDNLKNLFEMPLLLYVLVLYLFVTRQVDTGYVAAAWVFVVFRFAHSAVHCTSNVVIVRFYLYLAATLAAWFMAGRAAVAWLMG